MRQALLLERVDNPRLEPINHEQQNHNDQPKVGKASFLLTLEFLLVNLREAADEDHSQCVGNEGAIILKATVPVACSMGWHSYISPFELVVAE